MEPINLGTNVNWNRRYGFTSLPAPYNDPSFPNRIPTDVKWVGENRLIIIVGHAGTAKPWWISAGRIVVEADFQFDATTRFGDRLIVYEKQLLL